MMNVKRVAVGDEGAGMQMVHLLRGITVELDLFGAAFASEHRLHPTDLRALIHLLDADRAAITATPGWLGEQLGLNSASVTALTDRLESAGHVRRVRDTADRRRVLLHVEPSAVAMGLAFFGPLITQMVTSMRDFDESELATARRFLIAMTEVVTTSRRNRDRALSTDGEVRRKPGARIPGTGQ